MATPIQMVTLLAKVLNSITFISNTPAVPSPQVFLFQGHPTAKVGGARPVDPTHALYRYPCCFAFAMLLVYAVHELSPRSTRICFQPTLT